MGNALRVAALATLVAGETDDPMRDPASWGAGQCVAYLFLQGEQSMALSDVWQEYLNSCPPGSYTVHVHAQQVRGAGVFGLSQAALVAEPVTGELRFKVGDEVFARTGRGWEPGIIIKLWDEGNPYRIELEDGEGTNVWGPMDDDMFVKPR